MAERSLRKSPESENASFTFFNTFSLLKPWRERKKKTFPLRPWWMWRNRKKKWKINFRSRVLTKRRMKWIIFLRTRWLLSENFNNLLRDHKSFYFYFQFFTLLKTKNLRPKKNKNRDFFGEFSSRYNNLHNLSAFALPSPPIICLPPSLTFGLQ